jgi:hypothetical protein
MTAEKQGALTREAGEHIAIDALAYLAGAPEALDRFLALTGLSPDMLRSAAGDPAFLEGVLDYFLGDEPLLVAYAAHAAMPPERIVAARRALGEGSMGGGWTE